MARTHKAYRRNVPEEKGKEVPLVRPGFQTLKVVAEIYDGAGGLRGMAKVYQRQRMVGDYDWTFDQRFLSDAINDTGRTWIQAGSRRTRKKTRV